MADAEASKMTQTFKMKDAPITEVKVYQDQAEVTRVLNIDSVTLGEQTIILQGATRVLKEDTIRVTGKGDASVLEVSFRTQSKQVRDETVNEEEQNQKRAEWEKQIEELTRKNNEISCQLQRAKETKEFVETYATTLSTIGKDGSTKVLNSLLDKKTLNNITNFTAYYKTQLATFDQSDFKLRKEIADLDEQIKELRRNINQLKPLTKLVTTREIVVLIQGHQQGKASLIVSYVVPQAKWHAQYDIRVKKDNSIELTYYGVISQSTNEHWKNVSLSLSTAKPSGNNYAPPTLQAMIIKQQPVYNYYNRYDDDESFEEKKSVSRNRRCCEKACCCEAQCQCCCDCCCAPCCASLSAPPPAPPPAMKVATSTAKQGATASSFSIERPATIPSDNDPHKVTIAVIKLEDCKCEYTTVPCKDETVYLKVKAKNTSDFTLLAGDMSIFFENNYVAKSKLKSISPAEEFETFLGPDEGIKVEYKLPQKNREKKGFISTTNKQRTTNKFVVKNNKQVPITLMLKDRFPEPTNKDIVVKLIEPEFADKVVELSNVQIAKDCKATKIKFDPVMKHLEWEISLAAGQKVAFGFTVDIEWPSSYEIAYSD